MKVEVSYLQKTECHPCTRRQAKAAYSPDREGWFSAYPIRADAYPPHAREDFRDRVLGEMRRWLQQQMAKPDTAVLGYEFLIAEWDGTAHRLHTFTLP